MKKMLNNNPNKHKPSGALGSCFIVVVFLLLSFFATSSFAIVSYRSAASASSGAGVITFVGAGASANANGANVTPGYPAGWSAGDLLLCIVEARDNIVLSMPGGPGGWQSLSTGTSGAAHRAAIFWKIAATADDTTPTVTHSGGNVIVAQIIGFRGVDQTTPFDAANSFTVSGADLTTEAAAITTVTANTMLVFTAHMADNHTSIGLPVGSTTWTQAFFTATNTGNDAAIAAHYGLRTATGAQAAVTATRAGGANAISHGAQIALRPATSTLTINKPAGTVTGDVMIASVSVTPSTITITPPVGWTEITGSPLVQGTATSSRLATFYRVAGVGEPASYIWSLPGGSHNGAVGGIMSFSGVDNSTPIDAQAGQTTASGTSHIAPSVSTTQANGMLVTAHELASSRTWTPPGGMTEAVDVASLAPSNASGISMEMNYEVLAAAGATGTRTATVGGNADTGAAQSVALRATPLVCFTDDFNRADGSPGSDWVVSSISGTFGAPVIVNNRLRLTNASGSNSTMANLQRLFPGSGNRIEVEFDDFAYGGSGADGIALILSDATVTATPGAFGGSLGYAQKSNPGSDCTVPGGCAGFAGGWLGVGIDEFGNFSNPTEGRSGGPGQRADSVSVRGSGSGMTGYAYHTGTASLAPGIDQAGATPAPGYRYRIIVDHQNSTNAFVSVERNTGAGYATLIASYDAKAQAGQATVPTGWLLSYTGSTGGATNIHEIDNLQVCATQQVPLSGIHHFDITVGTSASTCSSQSVTIVAKDINDNTLTGYTGSITITTSSSHGDWSAPATNGTADDGIATYTFVATDNGSITLSLTNTHADDLTVNVTDTTVPSTSTTSSTISFRDSAFVITPDPIQIAGRDQTMSVRLVTGGSCATDTNYTGTKNLDAWLTRDPSDPGATAPTIGALSLPNAAPASNPASNNLSLVFTNGVATITMATTDVGKYVLNLRDDTRLYANAIDLGGTSPSILTRPWLHVAVTGNPAASAASGTVFTTAGTNFAATVRGVLWQAADDADDDGVPDAGANLANNTIAASYAWLTTLSAVSPHTPGTGTLGALNNGSVAQASFSGGSASIATLQYTEVGSFTMQGAATNYLNSGINLSTANGVVGRFTPAYFDVTRTQGCPAGSFTYAGVTPSPAGQTFSVTATALNALGAVTVNYHSASGFAKTTTISDAGVTTGFTNNSLAAASAFTNGAGTTNTIYYSFAAKETAPLTITLRAVDTDGISSSGHIEQQTEMRSGRIFVQNAFGSELLALPMPLRAQYYQSSTAGWVTHNADTCTSLTTANLDLGNAIQNPALGVATITINSGPPVRSTTATIANSPLSAGDAGLSFSAPNGEGYTDVLASLASMVWLRYDWDGNGTHDNDPSGRATFGIYKGSPRHIYLRERY